MYRPSETSSQLEDQPPTTYLDGVDMGANVAVRVQLDDVHGREVLEALGHNGRLSQLLQDVGRLYIAVQDITRRLVEPVASLVSCLVTALESSPGLQRERSISLNLTMTLSQWFSS